MTYIYKFLGRDLESLMALPSSVIPTGREKIYNLV